MLSHVWERLHPVSYKLLDTENLLNDSKLSMSLRFCWMSDLMFPFHCYQDRLLFTFNLPLCLNSSSTHFSVFFAAKRISSSVETLALQTR